MEEQRPYTCCFIGHRKITRTDDLKRKVETIVRNMIIRDKVNTFLFGNKSEFNDLCYEVVSELKAEYAHIKRVYVRSHFPEIQDGYKNFLLKSFEETYYPERVLKAGRAAYIERNREMIDKSKFCVMYYDKSYVLTEKRGSDAHLPDCETKSGTRLAYDYAVKKGLSIINIFN